MWYLETIEQDIIEQQLNPEEEELIVRKVIRRLTKKDQVFLAIDSGSSSSAADGVSAADRPNPLLVVHPSYISIEDL
jgi:DNA replication licensing factor MCM6